jgi:hypothetical protein
MNVRQPIIPTITIILPYVLIQGVQVMNPNIGHMIVPINY